MVEVSEYSSTQGRTVRRLDRLGAQPLASADHAGLVVYIGTLSKILAPGLRVGYVVAPPPVLRSMSAIRSLFDIQGDRAASEGIPSGETEPLRPPSRR